jgi:hypothetical protein
MGAFGGVYGEVEGILIEELTQTMYDLTVEEVHTFAVGKGEWVVHNCTYDRNDLGTEIKADGTTQFRPHEAVV